MREAIHFHLGRGPAVEGTDGGGGGGGDGDGKYWQSSKPYHVSFGIEELYVYLTVSMSGLEISTISGIQLSEPFL